MLRRYALGVALGCAITGLLACSSSPQNQPATPTAVTTTAPTSTATAAPAEPVDGFVGQWNGDTGPVGAAEAAKAASSCTDIEFRVFRDTDSASAAIVFAATCARVRIRGEGKGLVAGGTLHWRAAGTAALAGGKSCRFAFLEGNTATPAGEGMVKVTYSGTVCDVPVSGTETIRRR
jgi:hypothetical protein